MKNKMKHVVIPNDFFFKMACKDYYNWQWALVREFIQNSVDAGSTVIKFKYENGFLTVHDNGCGMDLATIEKALLTLGGSHKAGESVGGIGKAKEILYFSWPEWTIRTGRTVVNGKGCQYEVLEAERLDGVFSCIKIGNLIPNIEDLINRYISACSLPGIKFSYNDIFIDFQPLEHGNKLTSIEGLGDLHECLSTSNCGVVVQSHGLYMFTNHAILDKSYVFNITMPSYECLTANRDSFVGDWNDQFNKMVGKVAIDTESTRIRKEQIIYVQKLSHGSLSEVSEKDLFDTVQGNSSLKRAVAEHAKKDPESINTEDVFSFIEKGLLINENIIDGASGNTIRSIIKTIKKGKLLQDCMNWYKQHFKEGFMIVSEAEINNDMIYNLYLRETLQMAILWKDAVDFLAEKATIQRNYGYGFVIAEDTIARCHDGYLLFNPEVFEPLNWSEAAFKMLVAGAEELIHHIGYDYHNERFKCRYIDLLEMALNERVYVDDFIAKIRKVRKTAVDFD